MDSTMEPVEFNFITRNTLPPSLVTNMVIGYDEQRKAFLSDQSKISPRAQREKFINGLKLNASGGVEVQPANFFELTLVTAVMYTTHAEFRPIVDGFASVGAMAIPFGSTTPARKRAYLFVLPPFIAVHVAEYMANKSYYPEALEQKIYVSNASKLSKNFSDDIGTAYGTKLDSVTKMFDLVTSIFSHVRDVINTSIAGYVWLYVTLRTADTSNETEADAVDPSFKPRMSAAEPEKKAPHFTDGLLVESFMFNILNSICSHMGEVGTPNLPATSLHAYKSAIADQQSHMVKKQERMRSMRSSIDEFAGLEAVQDWTPKKKFEITRTFSDLYAQSREHKAAQAHRLPCSKGTCLAPHMKNLEAISTPSITTMPLLPGAYLTCNNLTPDMMKMLAKQHGVKLDETDTPQESCNKIRAAVLPKYEVKTKGANLVKYLPAVKPSVKKHGSKHAVSFKSVPDDTSSSDSDFTDSGTDSSVYSD